MRGCLPAPMRPPSFKQDSQAEVGYGLGDPLRAWNSPSAGLAGRAHSKQLGTAPACTRCAALSALSMLRNRAAVSMHQAAALLALHCAVHAARLRQVIRIQRYLLQLAGQQ